MSHRQNFDDEATRSRKQSARRPCRNAAAPRDSYYGKKCERLIDTDRSWAGFKLCAECGARGTVRPLRSREARDDAAMLKRATAAREARAEKRAEAARKTLTPFRASLIVKREKRAAEGAAKRERRESAAAAKRERTA